MQAQIVDESSTRRSGNSRCDSDGESLDLCLCQSLSILFLFISLHFVIFLLYSIHFLCFLLCLPHSCDSLERTAKAEYDLIPNENESLKLTAIFHVLATTAAASFTLRSFNFFARTRQHAASV